MATMLFTEIIDLSHEFFVGMPNIAGLAVNFWSVETISHSRKISQRQAWHREQDDSDARALRELISTLPAISTRMVSPSIRFRSHNACCPATFST